MLHGAVAGLVHVGEHGVHSYEQVKDGIEINGKKGYRVTAFGKAGDYVRIDYEKEDGAQSFVYDYLGNKIGVGDMDGGNYFVIPYVINGTYFEQYHDLRTTLLKNFLKKTQVPLVWTDHAGVYAYLYEQRGKKVLVVVNSTEEDFDSTDLWLQGWNAGKIFTIDRKSGKKRRVRFEEENGKTTIFTKNGHLTTQTFLVYE